MTEETITVVLGGMAAFFGVIAAYHLRGYLFWVFETLMKAMFFIFCMLSFSVFFLLLYFLLALNPFGAVISLICFAVAVCGMAGMGQICDDLEAERRSS